MNIQIDNLASYIGYNSVLILSMFFISFIALILNYITKGKSDNLLFENYKSSLVNPFTYIRFFTHSLGHVDWEHFSNNYVTILLIGPMIEEKYGTINLLLMMLVTSLVVGIVNFFFIKHRIKGASDIVFMLIVLASFVNIEVGKVPLTFILIFIFYVVKEIRNIRKKDGVSHIGHLLGAICGGVFGFLYINGITLVDLI